MGWIEKVKEIIKKLGEFGKSEREIGEVLQRAADAATVIKVTTPACIDNVFTKFTTTKDRRATNNWKRLHGVPMHRMRAIRRLEGNGKAAGKNCHSKNV